MQIPETLSHYRILKKLGQGGMGEVYLAEDATLGRTVALKILPEDVAADTDRLRRFVQEAKAASVLKHPNVASIYELSESTGLHFIVMEHVEGQSLDQKMQSRHLPIQEVLDIAVQTADALDEAHSRGIVHRDIKPSNIMITPRGQVKVLDFGLAKITSVEQPQKNLSEVGTLTGTEPGIILGTVQYMSPEQALGRAVDARSDLFSLGITLYQMSTSRLPFTGKTPTEIINSIVNNPHEPVTRLNYNVPSELDHIIRKCLEKDPERRYQTARELLIDLRNLKRDLESGSPVTAVASRPAVKQRSLIRNALLLLIPLLVVFGAWFYFRAKPEQPGIEVEKGRKVIVVLPFENLGAAEDEYFADGMTEEITSRLATVKQLGVISRTSALQYKKAEKSIKQIGEELGVDYVLIGTVRWSHSDKTSRVRVTPQLVRVSDDTQVWSQIYDHVIEDVFQVQSDIATHVISQLDVSLVHSEQRAIAAVPTNNIEAYQTYLRGRDYYSAPSYDEQHLKRTVDLFERATQLDPHFSQAFAMLARTHLNIFHEGIDASPSRLRQSKEAVDQAIKLQSDSPDTLLALGYYHYHGLGDYDTALKAFYSARNASPNDVDILHAIAFVLRRQGKFEESLDQLQKSLILDPRSSQTNVDIAAILSRLRRYKEADGYYERAIALAPEQPYPIGLKALNQILWKGDLEAAERIMKELPAREPVYYERFWIEHETLKRNFEEAISRVNRAPFDEFQEEGVYLPNQLSLAFLYLFMNQQEKSRSYFREAVSVIEAKLQQEPDTPAVHAALGLAYAGLGNKERAIAACNRALELRPVSRDAFMGPRYVMDLAAVYTMLGEKEEALNQLDLILSAPAWFSVDMLKLHPIWDPLRNHPGYAQLLRKYS